MLLTFKNTEMTISLHLFSEFVKVQKLMEQLIFMRRQLHVGVLTQDQTRTLKLKVAEVIDAGNRGLGLELVPRDPIQ